MRLVHLLQRHWDGKSPTGVPRFSRYFSEIFPEVVNVETKDWERFQFQGDELVVTDNHLSLLVPESVPTIVVHHGCAATHFGRDPEWRTESNRQMVKQQHEMFRLKNRMFVAPSLWVRAQFCGHVPEAANARYAVIPHWVPLINTGDKHKRDGEFISCIGDWRNFNKGRDSVRRLSGRSSKIIFTQLDFPAGSDKAREIAYEQADCYLCLSLSEGNSFSMADAEAASLPILSTDCGAAREFKATIIDRENPKKIIADIVRVVAARRTTPSFFESFTKEVWKSKWEEAISSMTKTPVRPRQRQVVTFGLNGGIGNMVFCLPAIKTLAETNDVHLYVEGDYPAIELFERCRYAKVTDKPEGRLLCGQYAPIKTGRAVKWQQCGWARGQSDYSHPEWQQVLRNAAGREGRIDVSDWCKDYTKWPYCMPDVGIVPGCKPGKEWERKKWSGFGKLVGALEEDGFSVVSFGMKDEIEEAGLKTTWAGELPLERLPEALGRCGVLVGVDNGVMHLASSLGLPCVILYTAVSPIKGDPVGDPRINRKLWRGLACSPCQSTPRWHQCNDWRCRLIPMEEVFGAVMGLLQPRTLPVLASATQTHH